MQRLIFLGTGNAAVKKCYNTCFAVDTDGDYFLVDAGGGNRILAQLEKSGIAVDRVRHIFLSHAHSDHMLGVVWMLRMIAEKMVYFGYRGEAHVYCHAGLMDQLVTIMRITTTKKVTDLLGDGIVLHRVGDGEEREIPAGGIRFFDIGSTKLRQYGFVLRLRNGEKLVFVGDEPCRDHERALAENADWLLHEAFCLYAQREKYQPYDKHHVTVKEACEIGEELGVKNLVLYHTEEDSLDRRKELYTAEGKEYYSGNLYVPDDLEVFPLMER